jgi:hypothetical protein
LATVYIYIPLPICQKGDLAKITRQKSEIFGFKYLLFNILQILSGSFHLPSQRLVPTSDFSRQNWPFFTHFQHYLCIFKGENCFKNECYKGSKSVSNRPILSLNGNLPTYNFDLRKIRSEFRNSFSFDPIWQSLFVAWE